MVATSCCRMSSQLGPLTTEMTRAEISKAKAANAKNDNCITPLRIQLKVQISEGEEWCLRAELARRLQKVSKLQGEFGAAADSTE